MSKYALVISDDPESILKAHADEIRDFKKADWLYDGIVFQEDVTSAEIKEKVFANREFLPSIIIDGSSYLTAAKFSAEGWEDNVRKFIDLSQPALISFWVID